MALEHLVADFVGELEALDQAIADLRVADVLLVALPAFVQAFDGALQWGQVEGFVCHAGPPLRIRGL